MRQLRRIAAKAALLAGVLAVGVLVGGGAWAAVVEVYYGQETAGQQNKEEAIGQGLVKAVQQEALALVPGRLEPARQGLLVEYLSPFAKGFVQTYSEAGVTTTEQGVKLLLDVTVDSQALRLWLRDRGVLATVSVPRRYNLMVTGADDAAWKAIGRLQALCGLVVAADAETRLTLERLPAGWEARLEDEGQVFTSSHAQLQDAWFDVWGRYFAKDKLTAGAQPQPAGGATLILEVSGWYAPEGVEAFDKILREWGPEAGVMSLLSLTLRTTGIAARWRVSEGARQTLATRLDAYLPGRNLTYGFVTP